MPSSSICLGIGFLALCTGAVSVRAQDRFVSYVGRAVNPQSGAFLYGESHILHFRGERLVERLVSFTCHDGSVFARKTMDYVSPTAPDFALEDQSNGLREGVRGGRGAARTVFFRSTSGDAEKSATVASSADLVVDAGFDEYIRAHWQALLNGEPQAFDFVVPSRVASMRFVVKHLRSAPFGGRPTEAFELRAKGLVGWIVPTIYVYYSAADRILVVYDGLTDLHDKNGDNYKAHITFPLGLEAASESDEAEARRAPLRPCK